MPAWAGGANVLPGASPVVESCVDRRLTAASDSPAARREACHKKSIVLIDESPLRLASTHNLLRVHLREVALPFRGTAEFLAKRAVLPDLHSIIINVGMRSVRDNPVLEQLRRLQTELATVTLVVLSDREDFDDVTFAFRHGAQGFIPTSLEPLLVIRALKLVWAGGFFFPAAALNHRLGQPPATPLDTQPSEPGCGLDDRFPPRQLAVLRLLAHGNGNKDIARALSLEESTVKVHVRHIMRKLGASNRTEVALRATGSGMIPTSRSAAAASISC